MLFVCVVLCCVVLCCVVLCCLLVCLSVSLCDGCFVYLFLSMFVRSRGEGTGKNMQICCRNESWYDVENCRLKCVLFDKHVFGELKRAQIGDFSTVPQCRQAQDEETDA